MSSDHRARQAGNRAREEAEPRRREARAKGQVAKQREVIWTAGARTDLDEIVAYIAKDSPTAALAFLEEVLTTAESLMTLSERGRIVPELQEPVENDIISHTRVRAL